MSSEASNAADVVTSLPPLAPPPLLPRIDEPLPKLGSLEVIGDLPPLGLAPIDGMDFPAEENTQARPVDDALLERTRDDVTETAPTRKRPSTRPPTRLEPMPSPMSASIDGTEPTTRAAPMPETMVRSDFGELGVLRKRRSDRAPGEDGLSEEPSGERERPSPILYAAPVPSFDDVNPESEWSDGGHDGGAFPAFGSNDPTDSTMTELPSSPWPSRQAAPVTGSDDLSTAAERAPVPPGRYAPPSWSLPAARRPAAAPSTAHHSSFPPAHAMPAAHSVPVHSVAGAHPSPFPPAPPLGFSQAAIAYASSPMFQPQVPTVLTPPPPARPMRGMWFVAGTAFGVAFMFFATGLFGRSSAEAEAPASVAAPAQTVRARPAAPAQRPAPPAPRAPEMAAAPSVVAPPSVPVSSLPPTVLGVSGVAPKAAPLAEAPAASPKAEPVVAKSSSSSRHASKSSHSSSSSASSERRSASAGTPDVASTFGDALGDESSKPKASGSRASTKRAPVDDPDGLMDGADPTDLLGAALKP